MQPSTIPSFSYGDVLKEVDRKVLHASTLLGLFVCLPVRAYYFFSHSVKRILRSAADRLAQPSRIFFPENSLPWPHGITWPNAHESIQYQDVMHGERAGVSSDSPRVMRLFRLPWLKYAARQLGDV